MSAAHGFVVGDLHSMTAAKPAITAHNELITEADNHISLTNRVRLGWIHVRHGLDGVGSDCLLHSAATRISSP
jgi:hypothetical protein